MSIKIESDVPLPPNAGGSKKYPFDEMAVGQSFFVPATDFPEKSKDKALRTSATLAAKRLKMKFTARRVVERKVDGVRLWRTE